MVKKTKSALPKLKAALATTRDKLSGARKSITIWFSGIGASSLAFAQDIAAYVQESIPSLSATIDAATLKWIALGSFAIIAVARSTRSNAPLETKARRRKSPPAAAGAVDNPEA